MKHNKTISIATVAAFLVVTVAQPIASAAEGGNMIDKSQQQAEAAHQQQDPQYQQMQQQQAQQIQQVQQQQQNFQTYLSPSGTVSQSRQTIYDTATGQLITLVQNNLGQIFAYTQSGQQVAVQQQWLNNITFPQTTIYSPTVGINGNEATGSVDGANISQTKAAQLSAVLSAIKADGNLNAVGKIAKALLALEAIKENNQIIRQQYLAQQKAKAQAQAEQEKKAQQAAQQSKAAVQQKQRTPTNAKKGEPAEYGSYLRDSEAETGGTATAVTINYSPTPDTQQDVREMPLSLDLIGKVASVSGSTVTLQDAKGQQIDVDAPESGLQEGDHINVSGTVLSGTDGNIYIVRDSESGMDVSLNQISQEDFKQKAAEQEQAAQEWASDHPDAGLEGVNEEIYAGPSEESQESGGSKWTWGKVASLGAIAIGSAMMGSAIAASTASGGTALPLTVPLFQAGASIAGSGLGSLVVQSFYQEAQEIVAERHPEARRNELLQKGLELERDVDFHITEADQ